MSDREQTLRNHLGQLQHRTVAPESCRIVITVCFSEPEFRHPELEGAIGWTGEGGGVCAATRAACATRDRCCPTGTCRTQWEIG